MGGVQPCPNGAGLTVPDPAQLNCASGSNVKFIRAHGACMLLSWGFLLPSGVLAARYLRHRPDVLWFRIHRPVQMLGLSLALIGWSIALSRFHVFGSGFNKFSLHGGLGMTVMVIGLLQPINALVRPHPKPRTLRRKVWEHIHKKSGYAAVLLGLVTVTIGVTLNVVAKALLPGYIAALVVLTGFAFCAKRDGQVQVADG